MRWRFLLRPGWVALTLAAAGFAVLAFSVLGPWQFHRAEQRDARNAAIERSFRTPPQPLRDVLPAGSAPGAGTEWRQVELTGRYLPEAETVVRLRTVLGEPAFEVLVPLRLTDGSTVLVDRGFLQPAPGLRVPDHPPAPSGEVTVPGRLRAGETDTEDRPAVERDGRTEIYAVDPATVGALTGLELQPGYVQLNAGAPGALGVLPLPQLSAGPHLAYALQWLAFGAMAPVGLVYFAWREGTGARRPTDVGDQHPVIDRSGGAGGAATRGPRSLQPPPRRPRETARPRG
ncbi:MAG: SURF1 family cytochrome oxidase biogenesis protein [Pseudonocardiaceae bacterium]